MRKAASAPGAVVLTGLAFAQQAPTYQDGEDGVNRTRPGSQMPGKDDLEARKSDVQQVDARKPEAKKSGEKADARKPLNPPKRTDKSQRQWHCQGCQPIFPTEVP